MDASSRPIAGNSPVFAPRTLAQKSAVWYSPSMSQPASPAPLRPLARLIFSTRWLQLPLYLGLIVAQCVYVALFVKEVIALVKDFDGHD